MAESPFESVSDSAPQGFTLDFKRVLSRAIRFWYVVVIFLAATLAVAFYKNRYSKKVYTVSASVLIREVQETGGAELLYKNALIDPYRNYLNEPYIIKSFPLVEQVIRDLNFHLSFLQEGYVVTSEIYGTLPMRAIWCKPDESKSGQLSFLMLDEHRFQLSDYPRDESAEAPVFHFGDSIHYQGFHLCIERVPGTKANGTIGVPLILLIQNPTSVAGSYIGRLEVKWAEVGAGIINLRLTGSLPDKEIDFLNALVATYRDLDLVKKNEAATRTVKFISRQLAEIKDSLRTVEFQLERFGNSSRVKDMSAEAQRLYTKLETFEIQKAELLIRQNYFSYVEEYLRGGAGELDQIILPSSMGITDPILTGVITRMVELQGEMKLYRSPEGVKNPLLTERMDQIGQLKKDVSEAVRTLRSTDAIKMNFLQKQLRDTERQLSLLPASERQLIGVQRNYALLENLYVFLMQKLSEASISEASNTSDIIPVNPAMRGSAIAPNPGQNYAIATAVGLLVPFVFFVLFEISNSKVQSKEDIDKMSSIPFLGGVGHNVSPGNLIVLERPKSGVAESFRAMRSNLNYFTGGKSRQVFMVSSSISGEGKTFTTINLSTVFALSGKKTLIVGADMRRPKIFEDFKRTNTVGLSTFLSGINQFDEVVQATEIENLFLVSGGPVPPNPSELLMTDRFELFVRQALEQFDFVIIDTPPLALVTDAFIISKYVNHTVFVLRQNVSPKQFISSIDEYYRSGKIKSISVLLNDIYKSGLGYGYGQGYAYHYGYAYGYGYGKRKKEGQGYYED